MHHHRGRFCTLWTAEHDYNRCKPKIRFNTQRLVEFKANSVYRNRGVTELYCMDCGDKIRRCSFKREFRTWVSGVRIALVLTLFFQMACMVPSGVSAQQTSFPFGSQIESAQPTTPKSGTIPLGSEVPASNDPLSRGLAGNSSIENGFEPDVENEASFVGTVSATSKYGFDVQTNGDTIQCSVDEDTEFALRLESPWFDFENRKVAVDGKPLDDGSKERVAFELPDRQFYLLTRFRSKQQMERSMAKRPLRINNYLLSPDFIEPNSPDETTLLLAGPLQVDGDRVSIEIDNEQVPIIMGFKGATLRGRSLSDLTVGQTQVMVKGLMKNDGSLKAVTVLFKPF